MHRRLPYLPRALLVAAAAALSVRPSHASDDACEQRCQTSYESCATVKAVGCDLGGALAGKAIQELGDQIPVPGMGALLGGLTKKAGTEKCKELLKPCESIRDTCRKECVPAAKPGESQAHFDSQSQTIVIQNNAPEQPRTGTLRVFANKPRMIVSLNGQRMGATLGDVLQPFVTPPIRVGKYWVELRSPDGRWTWSGEKDVDEGNVNAVEAEMVDQVAVERARKRELKERKNEFWNSIRSSDDGTTARQSIRQYYSFIKTYPDDEDKTAVAEKRIDELWIQAERDLWGDIKKEEDPQRKNDLCGEYVREFPNGPNLEDVQHRLAQIQAALAEQQRQKELKQKITRTLSSHILKVFKDLQPRLDDCRKYNQEELADAKGIIFHFRGSDGRIMGATVSGWTSQKPSFVLSKCLKEAVRGFSIPKFDLDKVVAEYRFN